MTSGRWANIAWCIHQGQLSSKFTRSTYWGVVIKRIYSEYRYKHDLESRYQDIARGSKPRTVIEQAFKFKVSKMAILTQDNGECIREELIRVRGVTTNVLKLGHLKEAQLGGPPPVLMLILTGNPGDPVFYEDFMKELYGHCEGQIPVWTLGQAGHFNEPGETLSFSEALFPSDELYGLEAQIAHKVAFIKENIPPDVSIILIGHSIGAYMIINALDQLDKSQIIHCFLLFPTLERMAESPNGKKLGVFFYYFRLLLVLGTYFLFLVPKSLYAYWYRDLNYPPCMMKAFTRMLNPGTVNNIIYLCNCEMVKVKTLQKDLVERYADKLSLYYGARDKWAPTQHYYDLIATFPKIDAQLCALNLKHAFVIDAQNGRDMAKIVWQWIQSHPNTAVAKTGD